MTDKDDLEKRVAKLEKAIRDLWDRMSIEALDTRLMLWPHHHDAEKWREDRQKIIDQLPESHPAKTGQTLQ
jgi:hypothetical protein